MIGTPMTLRDLREAINALPVEMDTLAVYAVAPDGNFCAITGASIENGEPTVALESNIFTEDDDGPV